MVNLMQLLMVVAMWSMPGAVLAQAQAPATQEQTLKAEELDQLVSPIALYPDTLLAEVLMAATYPLEVVQADRWASDNKNLKGDQLKAAVDKQGWDDSVKSLVATPSVLTMMSTKLDWTQKLGDAVLAQQTDVMDAIQRLRTKAQANNKLTTTKEQKVSTQQEGGKQVIVIEPTAPDTIYVPYYDPAVVYGAWDYPAYPPYYFPPPVGYVTGAVLATGLAFGAGYAVGRWASGGNYWGGGCNWGRNNINVNRPININNANINNWTHNSAHRHGVRYTNANVQQKFGNRTNIASGNQRLDFRGHSGNQVLRPDGDRGNIGDRGAGGDRGSGERQNIGDRDRGDRPNAGDRNRGDRPNAGDRKPDRSKVADRGSGNRPNAGDRKPGGGDRPRSANRPQRDNAFGNMGSGATAHAQANRGRASMGGGGGINRGGAMAHGGGARVGGGGGGRGGGGRGGGRR